MRKRKPRKTDPKRPPETVPVTLSAAAQGQVETAIRLWFAYGDVSSIHTLAAAANGCYHAAGGKGGPTRIQEFIKSLPRSQRRDAFAPQNFLKHGPDRASNLRKIPLFPMYAEMLIFDSIFSHEQLFGKRTALMTCFIMRLGFEMPGLIARFFRRPREQVRSVFRENVPQLDRVKFLETSLPLFGKLPADSGSPP